MLSSLKAILLFVFVSELENAYSRIATQNNQDATENNLNNDNEALIDTQIDTHKSSMSARLFHVLILITCLLSCVYTVIKFALVLNLIIAAESSKDQQDLPMAYFYFAVLTTEMGFSLIQLIFSLLSWKCMNSFLKQLKDELIVNNSSSTRRKK